VTGRGEKYGHRPAALPGHRDDGVHVNAVQVRPFLPVHFHVDEMLVHESGRLRIFERFVRHHVAPMAGRVADAQQNRLVFFLRFGQRFLPPWIPVDRIVGVL
jgi:hypothetical protein